MRATGHLHLRTRTKAEREKYKEGIYVVRILQGKQVKQLKLVKLPGETSSKDQSPDHGRGFRVL
jgi:hypothetical protein